MSIRVMSWVWDKSPASGSGLLLLLAIADHADDEGENAYPSVKTLMHKTRMSRSSVFRALKELVECGWLEITERGKGRDTSHYRIVMDAGSGVRSTPPEVSDRDPSGVNVTPHPSQDDTPEVSDRHGRGVNVDTAEVSLLTPRTVLEPKETLFSSSGTAPRKRGAATNRGSRLPEEFPLPEDQRDWYDREIASSGIDVRIEHAKFCDYFRSAPGAKGVKTDWKAAWRNWMRKAAQDASSVRPSRNGTVTFGGSTPQARRPAQRPVAEVLAEQANY